MIKRPLAFFSVVFILVLFSLQMVDETILKRDPVSSTATREKSLLGYLQDDWITLYGVVSDYSYENKFEKITTEVILKDVHILDSKNRSTKDSSTNFSKNPMWTKITAYGQSILVYINEEEPLSIGNQILLSGKLSFFEPATNPGQFDAERFYENRDVLFSVKKAVVEKKTDTKAIILQTLKEFRVEQEEKLEEYLFEGYAEIMKAMLLGNKQELDAEMKELYQDNGIAHVLAISGLHISLLGMSVYRLLRRMPLPSWLALGFSEIFLVLYGCMVGFSASSFRAIGMFTFFLLSKITKRSYDMLTALGCIAILQLIIHPGYLFDCSFQLSYAAILGIGILLPALEKINKVLPWERVQKGIGFFLPSLSVTLTTTPILILNYYEISFFSILLNVIVLPFMSALLLCTIAMLLCAGLVPILAKVFALPVVVILGIYEYSCRFLELFPIGQKNVASPSVIVLLFYYGSLILMTVLVKKKSHSYHFFFVLFSAFLLLWPRKSDFSVWMLDVGQGDCNVIFTEEGNCFVIDCGSTSEYRVGERVLIPFLKYHGVEKVDGVFVTHADADHMSGVLELIEYGAEENIEVSCIVLYEKALETEPDKWEALCQFSKEQNIPIKEMGQGDAVRTDTVSLTCLYPLKEQRGLTGNASSLVLELTHRSKNGGVARSASCLKTQNGKKEEGGTTKFRALFTGDLEINGENMILEEYAGNGSQPVASYDLLKVGHHGSSGSSSTDFLSWVSADYAFISCGKNNSYGHPHKETLERLADAGVVILATPECGAIIVKVSDGGLTIRPYTGNANETKEQKKALP